MTLVELMITMIIRVHRGRLHLHVLCRPTARVRNPDQDAQRAAKRVGRHGVLSRFVRSEEQVCSGCVRPVGGIVASPPPNRSLGVNPDNSDDPPVVSGVRDLSQRPNAGLRAYNAATGQVQRIPPLWIVDQVDPNQPSTAGIVGGTDVITVAFGNRSSGTNFDSPLQGP